MKKLTAIFAVVLTLALLLGAVVGVSASAAEDTPAAQADEKWVISANVAYADDIHPYFAIDATLVADASLLSVTVGGRDAAVSQEPISIKEGVSAYVVEAAGVPAKNMGKALPIVVTYNGEVVEETSYSVAEYFYERLYKNDVINATEAADLLRKDLYLSTLEYGAAAQKVLAPGTTPVTELVFVDSPEYSGMWDGTENYVTTAKISKVTSYPFGEKTVVSYINAGHYKINYPAVIEEVDLGSYVTPEDATDFEDFEANDSYVFDESLFANSSVTVNHYDNTSSSVTAEMLSAIVAADDGKHLSLSTGSITNADGSAATSGAQTWVNVKRKDATSLDRAIMFEAKINFDLTGKGNSMYMRFYKNGSVNKGNDGTVFGVSGGTVENRNILFTATNGNLYIGDESILLGHKEGEWFTLRLVITNVSGGAYIDVYTSEEGSETLKHRGTVDRSGWGDANVGDITNVVMMHDSNVWFDMSLDDVYLGPVVNKDGAEPAPTVYNGTAYGHEFEDTSAYHQAQYLDDTGAKQYATTENGTPIPSFKGQLYEVKDIMTARPVGEWFLNDPKGNGGNSGSATYDKVSTLDVGQATFEFAPSEAYSEGNTFVFESDYRINGNDGLTHFDIRIRNSAGKGVYRIYFGNGQLSLNKSSGDGHVKTETGLYKDGEWFTIRVEYTVSGESADTATYLVNTYVNDELVATNTAKTLESYYGASSDIGGVGLLLSKEFRGTFEFRNINMYWKNV